MKNKNKIILRVLLSINLFFLISIDANANTYNKLENYIINNNTLKNASISVIIKDLDKDKVLINYNANKLMTPASNIKILTSFLALEKLGKNYVFRTNLSTDAYTDAETENFSINNLYVNMSGDPTFKSKDLKKLVEDLRQTGIKEIKGNVYIDKSIFDNIIYGPGWMWDDLDECDDSPISPIYLDDNCLVANISIKNNKVSLNTNNSLVLNTDNLLINDNSYENIESNLKGNILTISGKANKNTNIEIERSIKDHESYFTSTLENYLKEIIAFSGKILINNDKNPNTIVLAEKKSEPLYKILKRFNEESHNLTGELLLKTIAYNEDKKQGSTKKGKEILKKHLNNLFKNYDFNVVDGSGLSRYNLISSELLLKVLETMYKNPEYKEIIYEAFPIGGLEGTLRNRLKEIKNYKVIAKSGSMTGVNALSGYLVGKNKNTLGFSIIINNSTLSGKQLRDIQDQILELVN
ncbi:MAG: D-alanyl-D-alanine carboxypeptidase/D-alanyl-D-alanine-endopeptidase [Candidatus Sericytochromatia bacterium]